MSIDRVEIEVVPHDAQRYDTAGDWVFKEKALYLKVSAQSDWRHEMLLAVHEMVEAVICKHIGVSDVDVDLWDMVEHADSAEPGEVDGCPYGRAHQIAEIVERLLAVELGVKWSEYMADIQEVI